MWGMILQFIVIGIAMGMVYAFMAMGVILLVRAVGVMNFAQGDILMLGAYISFGVFFQLKMSFLMAALVSLLIFAIGGVAFMFSVYWPLRKATWSATVVISTIGASIVLREGVKFIWGTIPLAMSPVIKGVLLIGNARLEYQYLVIIAFGMFMISGVFLLFEKLYAGRAMQAAAQDKYAAELIGIPTIKTTMATYIISISLASVGGFLVAPLFLVSLTLGMMQLKAFAGIVIGGFGNIKGAVVGSMIVGLVESFSTLFTSTYKDAVVFLVLIVFLVVRPQGIYGERIAEKA